MFDTKLSQLLLLLVSFLVIVLILLCFARCYFSRRSNSISKDTAAKLNVSTFMYLVGYFK